MRLFQDACIWCNGILLGLACGCSFWSDGRYTIAFCLASFIFSLFNVIVIMAGGTKTK